MRGRDALNGGNKRVTKDHHLTDVSPEFKDKVFTIADEVLKILKELSLENKTNIDSNQIAERMFWKDSLQGLLDDIQTITEDDELKSNRIKELSNLLLNKFSELIPAYVARKLGDMKDALHNKTMDGNAKEWIDSPLEVIKAYIDSISVRNNDLEEYFDKTTKHITTTEENMSQGLSFQQQQFNDHIAFENSIFSDMDELKQDLSSTGNVRDIHKSVMKKIEDICNRIELKRKQDIQHIKEWENKIEEMNMQMSEIRRESDEVLRKSKGIEYEASHDKLTGVYNRKAYEKKMNEIFADVTRYDTTVSLMICDIDYLKKINDKWGHKLGDLAIKKLAALIRERMRINDFIARKEGGEFAIILPHTDHEGARVGGERLRAFIDKAEFVYKGDNIPLTISIGISCISKGDTMDGVSERTGNALRLAKESGRNRVVIDEKRD
jgi:diguanylate cyclase (GGDEF)-like protein